MKNILLSVFLIVFTIGYAQVGINTTTPSSAAVLHLESLNSAGTYGGFMPPVVDLAQRALMPITAADDGLMIYLVDGTTRCVQIYNATDANWVDFYCMPIPGPANFQQDFDTNILWTYTSNVTYFQNGTDGYYDVTDGTEFSGLVLTNDFFGTRDLDDEGDNGTTGESLLTFDTVDVSAITGATLTFDYDSNGFNSVGNDYFGYEVFHDGTGQGYVSLCNGCDDGSNGTVSVAIPNSVVNFYIVLTVKCNGGSDYMGFDEFLIQ